MMYCVYILYRNTQSIYKVHKAAYISQQFSLVLFIYYKFEKYWPKKCPL